MSASKTGLTLNVRLLLGVIFAATTAYTGHAEEVAYDFQFEVTNVLYTGSDETTAADLPSLGEVVHGTLRYDTNATPIENGASTDYPQAGFDASMQITLGNGLEWSAPSSSFTVRVFDRDSTSTSPDAVRFAGDATSLINRSTLQVDHMWVTLFYESDVLTDSSLRADYGLPDPRFNSCTTCDVDLFARTIADNQFFRIMGRLTSFRKPDGSADGPPGQIVYFSNEIEGFFTDLFVINEDGTGKRQLTFATGSNDLQPAFSPDGRRVAFASDRSGDMEIYVINIDGSNLVRLTHEPGDDQHPDFSPDGETIVFQSNRDHLCGHDNCDSDIYAMNAYTGQNITRLTGAAGDDRQIDQQPAYFPDGEKLVFNRIDLLNDFGPQNLWILDLSNHSERQLTDTGRSEGSPTVSPGGAEVAFQGVFGEEQDAEVLIVSVADGTVHKVTDNGTFPGTDFQISDGSPSWSPTADRIVYHADTDDTFNLDLYLINSDGSNRVQLTTHGGIQNDPDFGPPTALDTDGDGLLDDVDACSATPDGAIVDADGCSGDQLVAIACPATSDYRSHGKYVSCVSRTAEGLVGTLLTEEEKDAMVSTAGSSGIGRRRQR